MSETFYLSSSDPTPLYAQLARAIKFAIATGRLNVGDQLPTVRQMAVDLRINANTVARVYTELERKGILETRRGVGTFIGARHFEAGTSRHRKEHLHDFMDRLIAEAGALEFSIDDLIDQLQNRRKKERKHV
jgi:GntR family transcriptional regulator